MVTVFQYYLRAHWQLSNEWQLLLDLLIYLVSYHSLVFMKILRFLQFLFVAVLLRWFFLNSQQNSMIQ